MTNRTVVDERKSTASIEDALAAFCKNWGPISWRDTLAGVSPGEGSELGRALVGLGAIEIDSRVIARKVRAGRIDVDPRLHEFLILWQAEESEHGRALDYLGRLYGCSEPMPIRERVELAAMAGSRALGILAPNVARAAYCMLGAFQEYIALKTYLAVSEVARDRAVKSVLKDIAAQESRHMKFYATAAKHFLDGHVLRQRMVRAILQTFWAPPGVDLLGEKRFIDYFGFLLSKESYVEQVVGVDSYAERIPGMGSLDLMRRWLERHGAMPGAHIGVSV